MHERTFLAVKPDGVQRRLVGEIVRRFERKGFKLVALKLVQVSAGVSSRGEWGGVYGRGAGPWGPGSPSTRLVALPPQASEELLREHYAELRERPFFGRLVKYMGSGPVVAMVSVGGRARRRVGRWPSADLRLCRQVWQGLDVVRASRALIGATNPADAAPGTIRGDFCIEVGK